MANMKPSDRLCLWCNHIGMSAGGPISETTWDSGEMSCSKNLWPSPIISDNPVELHTGELFRCLNLAKTCIRFSLKPEIQEILNKKEKSNVRNRK